MSADRKYPKGFRLGKPILPGELEAAYAEGMIRHSDLKDGVFYYGRCRNAVQDVAIWVAELNVFVYQRQKFGSFFLEDICHPEQDNGFDLFTPEDIGHPDEKLKAYFDEHLEAHKTFAREMNAKWGKAEEKPFKADE
jgi:hypothetical protein